MLGRAGGPHPDRHPPSGFCLWASLSRGPSQWVCIAWFRMPSTVLVPHRKLESVSRWRGDMSTQGTSSASPSLTGTKADPRTWCPAGIIVALEASWNLTVASQTLCWLWTFGLFP